MKAKNVVYKRSIGSFSAAERQVVRDEVIKNAVSSKEAASEFLKNAGILNKRGDVDTRYK